MAILAEGQIAATKETILLVKFASVFPATKAIIKRITFFNKAPGMDTVTLFIKKKGGVSRTVHAFNLGQNESGEYPPSGDVFQLDDGDELEASASTGTDVSFIVLGELIEGIIQKR